ncbi:MAG: hypothetical protein ABI165_03230 [Bryobacteraceae bacterium]
MYKRVPLALLVVVSMFAAAGQRTFTGVITDNMCDKADHKEMNMGPDAQCVSECIKNMGGKYVLYDGKTAYLLSDQSTPAQFTAKKVTVTGTLDAKTKTIQVTRISAAK